MAVLPRKIVLLAGRVTEADAAIRALIDRLTGLGFAAEGLCTSGGPALGLTDCPGLAVIWQRAHAVRRVWSGPRQGPPALLHVLSAEMAPVGLRLAEHWRIPYLQAVEEFIPPGGRLRISRRWCRGLLAPGQDLARDLVVSLGVPESLVDMVPPAISPPEAGDETGQGPEAARRPVAVVGAAGTLDLGSGLDTFLTAARRVIETGLDAEFVVAGTGPAETDLRRLADRLRIADRVTFAAPPGPRSTFWKVLDLFCQASRGPTVGRPLATALAHGVPCVASDVAGLRAWEGGLRVPPGDAEALSAAVLGLLADPDRARDLGRRGRDRIIEAFHPDREAGSLAEIYRRVLSAQGHDAEATPPAPTIVAGSALTPADARLA